MKNIYEGIAREIENKIQSGIYGPSEKLPSENGLAIKYNCSRLTARKALQLLKSKKLIITRRGKGYFVSLGSEKKVFQIVEDNISKKVQFHIIHTIPSPNVISVFRTMNFQILEEFSHFNFSFMKTHYNENDVPFMVLHSFVNTFLLGKINIACIKESQTKCFNEKGIKIVEKRQKIIITHPEKSIAIKLNLKKDQKVVTIFSLRYNNDHDLVSFDIRYTLLSNYVGEFTSRF